jgi:hypothetical protein
MSVSSKYRPQREDADTRSYCNSLTFCDVSIQAIAPALLTPVRAGAILLMGLQDRIMRDKC